MQDWTGNSTSVSATLGASNLSDKDRAENDYYATPPRAIDAVFQYLNCNKIWEPACGEGHLSKRLKELGFEVKESDKIIRSYPCEEIDFLNFEGEFDGDILTNPPFVFAKEFVEKSLNVIPVGRKVIMFLRVQFLESQKRRKLFDENPPKAVLVYSKQNPQCGRNGCFENTGNAAMYCWFVWEKGYKGDTVIRWI
jgi:hypothetical protein